MFNVPNLYYPNDKFTQNCNNQKKNITVYNVAIILIKNA